MAGVAGAGTTDAVVDDVGADVVEDDVVDVARALEVLVVDDGAIAS